MAWSSRSSSSANSANLRKKDGCMDQYGDQYHTSRMKSALFAILLFSSTAFAADYPDLVVQSQIRREGYHNSKVMETASALTDFIGPRLTGSPNMLRANEWTRDKLTEFGLSNAHLEKWGPFAQG